MDKSYKVEILAQEIIELPLNEAYSMVASGKIVDAKTIILLQHAMLD
jgi:hypothetical protein